MEAVAMIAQVEAGERGAPEGNKNASKTNHDIIMVCQDDGDTTQGTSTTYTMRRLAKDAPELPTE